MGINIKLEKKYGGTQTFTGVNEVELPLAEGGTQVFPVSGVPAIEGGVEMEIEAQADLTKGQTIKAKEMNPRFELEASTIDDPITGTSAEYAWSPDGTKLAVGLGTSRITIYSVSGNTYTKLPAPNVPPSYSVLSMAWSPDGRRLAVGMSDDISSSDQNMLFIYDATTTPFSKIADPDVPIKKTRSSDDFPVYGLAWNPAGTRLAVSTYMNPCLIIYDTTTTPYTKIADPATIVKPRLVAWSPDGTKLAISANDYGYGGFVIYDTTVSPYTIYTTGGAVNLIGYGIAWNPAGTRLAVGLMSSPYIAIYDTTVLPYTKITDPATMPTSNYPSRACAWSPDGTKLALDRLLIYDTTATPYTQISVPTGDKYEGCAWNTDGTKLAAGIIGYSRTLPAVYEFKHEVVAVPAYNRLDTANYPWYGFASENIEQGENGEAVILFT